MNLKQALIDNDSIRLGVTASDWKEAVKLAVEPLVEVVQLRQNIMMLLSHPRLSMVRIIF